MLQQLLERLTKRRQSAATNYRSLVVDVAKGVDVVDETVERLLASAGKAPEDLARDVELCQRRLGWIAFIDTAPAIEQEMKRLELAIADEKAKLERATAAYNAAAIPLGLELATARSRHAQVDEARRSLRQTQPDRSVLVEIETLSNRASAAVSELQRLKDDRDVMQRQLDHPVVNFAGGDRSATGEEVLDWQRRLAIRTEKVRELEAQRETDLARLKDLEASLLAAW
jgi:hypothetical protein